MNEYLKMDTLDEIQCLFFFKNSQGMAPVLSFDSCCLLISTGPTVLYYIYFDTLNLDYDSPVWPVEKHNHIHYVSHHIENLFI